MSQNQYPIYQNTLHPKILKQRPFRAFFYDSGPFGIRFTVSFINELAYYILNPMCYDGSTLRALKASFENNEAGFMIASTSFFFLVWILVNYRRTVLNHQKKLFVYQEYQKRRYIQKALGLRNYTKNYDYFTKKRLITKEESTKSEQ